jgi:E3 ubiquitin-protein ligase RGLG
VCSLVVGVDFTRSNEWTGKVSFGGRSLHALSAREPNPYQRVLLSVGRTLQPFDDDGLIPAFGFGDERTCDHSVFTLTPDGAPCAGLEGVLAHYAAVARAVKLSGPTNFGALIRVAAAQAASTGDFTVLVIVADGQVDGKADTIAAIVEATSAPLAIVCVGVGDGPWELMHKFDDDLPERAWDNFQFVCFEETQRGHGHDRAAADAAFALAALMELPEQYGIAKERGLLAARGSVGSVSGTAAVLGGKRTAVLGPPPGTAAARAEDSGAELARWIDSAHATSPSAAAPPVPPPGGAAASGTGGRATTSAAGDGCTCVCA